MINHIRTQIAEESTKISETKDMEITSHLLGEFDGKTDWIEEWISEVEKELKLQGDAKDLKMHIQSLEVHTHTDLILIL